MVHCGFQLDTYTGGGLRFPGFFLCTFNVMDTDYSWYIKYEINKQWYDFEWMCVYCIQ